MQSNYFDVDKEMGWYKDTPTYRNLPKIVHKGRPIVQLDSEGNKIREWKDTRKAAETLKISWHSINKALNGTNNYGGGFKWAYQNENN